MANPVIIDSLYVEILTDFNPNEIESVGKPWL